MTQTQAKVGDTVTVHYTGRLEDGTVFDSSANREPLQFTLGQGDLIPGFEQAVLGMAPGESKTETIPFDRAYGPYREEMVIEVDRQQLPTEIEPAVGQQLQVREESGAVIPVVITDVTDESITLDANHPLAGEELTFDIQLVDISA